MLYPAGQRARPSRGPSINNYTARCVDNHI